MHGLSVHLWVSLAVNGLLVFVWLLTSGSVEELRSVAAEPTTAADAGFWPIWPLALSATALVIHLGVVLSNALFGWRARRRRSRRRRELKEAVRKTGTWAEDLALDAAERASEAAGAAVATAGGHRHRRRDRTGRRRETTRVSPEGAGDATPPEWVTAMFTDIADSTSLTATLGDAAWKEVLADHRRVVRSCVDEHGGTEVSTHGDGFFVRHDDVEAALRCAVAIQERLAERRGEGLFTPEIRIGLHAGEVVPDEGDDLLGHVVNVASRVTDAAQAGEILTTETVADRAGPQVGFEERGLQELKGLERPRHLLRVVWEGPEVRSGSGPHP